VPSLAKVIISYILKTFKTHIQQFDAKGILSRYQNNCSRTSEGNYNSNGTWRFFAIDYYDSR